jgi:hypothetical protein
MSSPSSIWTMKVARPPESVDRGELLRALRLLVDPDATHEARSIPAGRSVLVRGSDLPGAVLAIEQIADGPGTCVTLNPVRPDLKGAARVADVLIRRHLLIDVDSVRPSNANATDAEKHEAERVIGAVAADLERRGWPGPLVIDSGNGWHLIYRIDLPNDGLSQKLLGRCLKALAAAHDTPGANVDTKVHNASRITKLPGTWARKGPHTPERPCRQARLVSEPTAFTAVPVEALDALAGLASETTGPTVPAGAWVMNVPKAKPDINAYVAKAVVGELDRVEKAPEGERNNALNAAAFNLGQLLSHGLARVDAENMLAEAGRTAGLGEHETIATVRSGLNAGQDYPREIKPRDKTRPRNADAKPEESDPARRLTIRASEVESKEVRWLWKDRVPIGFITMFAGETAVGKSFVTCDLAARVTNGEDLPDGASGLRGDPRNVLVISEDPYEFVVKPRLVALGADEDRVYFVRWEEMEGYTLADTDFLERCFIEAEGPALIVIDPPTNFLGDGVDEHKNSAVRQMLMHIVQWVKSKDAACVMITHVNKQSGKGVDAKSRVIGSVAWMTTSRVAHAFTYDPDEPGQCLFVPTKNNLGPMAMALGYRIESAKKLAVVKWTGSVDTTADSAMNGLPKKSRGVEAVEWLEERFRQQVVWLATDINRLAVESGLSKNALYSPEAKALPIEKKQLHDPDGKAFWRWTARPGWPPPPRETE